MNAPKSAEVRDSAPTRADSRRLLNSVIRAAVYMYFAAGLALLVSDGMVSGVRYQADKRFPASFLLVVFVGIFGLLGLANWDTFQRPINARKWIILCLLSSVGIVELLLAPTRYGATGA
jgi:hypothetical protein